jgi:hypothetical protein
MVEQTVGVLIGGRGSYVRDWKIVRLYAFDKATIRLWRVPFVRLFTQRWLHLLERREIDARLSATAIAVELNKRGVPTPDGRSRACLHGIGYGFGADLQIRVISGRQ